MNTLVIFLILISSITHTYWNYVLKRAINKGADPALLYWISGLSGLIFYSIIFLFFFISFKISYYSIGLSAVCGVFVAFYIFSLSKSYSHGDLSQVYPLAKITPLFTLLIGIFYLRERVSLVALVGIILIVFGAYSIHLKNFGFKNILKPIISLKSKASMFALLTAIVSAFYGLFSKLGVVGTNPFIFVYFVVMFGAIFYTPFLFLKKKSIFSQIKRFKKSIIQIGLLDLFTYSLIVLALSLSKLSYVFALRQMSILFSVFIGSYVLKEEYGRNRIIASVIIIIGVVLISIS